MKVTRIQAHHVKVPLAQPYVLSKRYGTIHDAHAVIVKLHTDEGLVGYGEADPMPPFTDETWGSVFAAIQQYLGSYLIGQDAAAISSHNAAFDQVLSGNLLAKGALDVALWDLRGKSLGQPVNRLLGGALRRKIALLWPFGSAKPAEDLERIEAKMRQGYTTFMIKMGANPIDVDIERVRAISETFGADVRLNVDANQGWTLAQAIAFMDGTRGCELDFVEQPLPRTSTWALQALRARARHPLSADESVQTLSDAAELAGRHLVDVFSLKVSKNGGISRALHIARVAQAFGIQCLVNSMIELGVTQAAALQVGALLPNLLDCGHCYMSTLRLRDDVTNFGEFIRDAVAYLPDAPGLGIELDEDKLARYSDSSIEMT